MNNYVILILAFMLGILLLLSLFAILERQIGVDFVRIFIPSSRSYGSEFFITFFAYLLIINTILPISLIITLNLARLF